MRFLILNISLALLKFLCSPITDFPETVRACRNSISIREIKERHLVRKGKQKVSLFELC